MKTVCKSNQCAGCMACIDICPKGAIKIQDDLFAYNAVISEEKCINCNACHNVCQSNNPYNAKKPIKWYQGWANDMDLRTSCSSGGLATAISEAFVGAGGGVCSCTFTNGEFIFEFINKKSELKKFIGSKYVKSNPIGTYMATKDILEAGQKVLFIGLPCQVAAMKNFIGTKLQFNLYTVDLICHGTPSPKLFELFMKQYEYKLSNFKNIQFRAKAKFMVYGDYKGLVTNGVSDKYSIAFLNALIYTDNCYNCTYAKKERVADLTLGDSWGTDLPVIEQKRGISLALCQTEKGNKLLKMADIHLEKVNLEKAVENNHQLKTPSIMPNGREAFFKELKRKKFNTLVFQQLPKQCLRQEVKQFLIKTKMVDWLRRVASAGNIGWGGGGKLNYSILVKTDN